MAFSYEYDGNGNITVEEKTVPTSEGTVTHRSEYTYDEAGYLTSIQKNGETYHYSWGLGRRLTEIQSISTGNKVTYGYNESGLRVSKTITENGTSTTTEYVWGEHGLAGFTTGDDTVVVLYGSDGAPVGFALNGVTFLQVSDCVVSYNLYAYCIRR